MGISRRGCLNRRRTGWRAPEHLLDVDFSALRGLIPDEFWHGQQTGDLFSLGCALFYCFTGGKHPYGDIILRRELNIKTNRKDLSLIESIPEALDLISHLLNPNPNMRPKAHEVLEHPLFWTSHRRLSFLRDACDHILELEDQNIESELLNALENSAATTLIGKWDEMFGTTFLNRIGGNDDYKFDTVRDLLRLIRNSWLNSHSLLAQLESLPEALDDYYSNKFPKLFIEVYKVFRKYCRDEEFVQKYKWSCVI